MLKCARLPDDHFGRYLRAGGWMTAGSLAIQILRLGRMWVLTWLLIPDYFGLAAIAWTVLAITKELSDTGLNQSFIQHPNALDKPFLHTFWTICLLRNLLLALMLFILAPIVATAYANTNLTMLIRLCSLTLLCEGLTSAGLMILRKQLQFKVIKLIEIIAQIGGIALTISLAWFWQSPSVLILGEAAIAAITCLTSYLVSPWRPRFHLDKTAAHVLLGFGIQIYLTELIMMLTFRIDILILGKIAPTSDLGLYCLAMTLLMALVLLFKQVTVQVGFPTYAHLQNDLDQLRNLTRKSILTVLPLAIVAFTLLVLFAPWLVRLLPDKYTLIAPTLRVLTPAGLFIVTSTLMTTQLYALKRLRGCLWMAILRLAVTALLIIPVYRHFGIKGCCLAMVAGTAMGMITIWIFTAHTLQWRLSRLLIDLAPIWLSLLAGITGAAAGFLFNQQLILQGAAIPTLPWTLGLILFCLTQLIYYSRVLPRPPRDSQTRPGLKTPLLHLID